MNKLYHLPSVFFADAIPMPAALSTFRVPPLHVLHEFFGTPTPHLVYGLPFSRMSWSLPVVSWRSVRVECIGSSPCAVRRAGRQRCGRA